jgi:hypothetical protein
MIKLNTKIFIIKFIKKCFVNYYQVIVLSFVNSAQLTIFFFENEPSLSRHL